MKTVTFYFSLLSPWVYFSGPRFQLILQRTGATAAYRPIDLFRIFRETGGTPLKDLHPSRRAYRAIERRRWATLLGMSIRDQPRHHPVDESLAARLLIAWRAVDSSASVWSLAQSILAGVWVEDLNIADPATLAMLAGRHGLDGAALLKRAEQADIRKAYETYTDEAMSAGVFGVPSFVADDELFFGQDRLDFVERALSR